MTAPVLPQLAAAYQPQEWIDDNAEDAGALRGFDAAPLMLSLPAEAFLRMDAEIRKDHGRDLDLLAELAGDRLTRGHAGPFEVGVSLEDYLAWLERVGFDPADVAAVDDAVMAKMRAEYGVAAHAGRLRSVPGSRGPADCVMLQVPMVDWRVGEGGEEDELSDLQKQVRTVTVVKAGAQQLRLEVANPDGTVHLVGLEFDRGNFRILCYPCDREQVAAVVSMTSEGLHIAAGGEDRNFVADEHGRIVPVDGPAPASFALPAAPKP